MQWKNIGGQGLANGGERKVGALGAFVNAMLALGLLCLQGCASRPPLKPPAEYSSFWDYAHAVHLREEDMVHYSRAEAEVPIKKGGVNKGAMSWCMERSEREEFQKKIQLYCQVHGGKLTSNFCLDQNGGALYYAKTQVIAPCDNTMSRVETTIVEPSQFPPSDYYMESVKSLGYLTPSEKMEREIQSIQAAKAARELAQAKHDSELPQMTKRGAQVCKRDGRVVRVGYVEDFNSPKIKIRVAGVSLGGRSIQLSDDAHQVTVWEDHNLWYLCE